MDERRRDVTIIGGGIIGLSTAMQIAQRHPDLRVTVLEKEERLAAHQTGHNSGVIHSGIYYRPGSLKAQNCVEGARALMAFCDRHGVRYDLCGKVIVATTDEEVQRLRDLHGRGDANGVGGLQVLGPEELRELEPHATGLMALRSPNTGIIDYTEVAQAYAREFRRLGGEVMTSTALQGARVTGQEMVLLTSRGAVPTAHAINCAGLYADVVATAMGLEHDVRIIPFRGEYYFLTLEAQSLVRGLIYPVPDPRFPFLGVHFTRTIHGGVEAGPNAVLAFAREGYRLGKVDFGETLGTLRFPGFWAMSSRYWKMGLEEFTRSASKGAFTRALQKLVPDVREHHLTRGGAGVRAQAVDRQGRLLDDFRIEETERAIHVLNAPSPGATASLAIGKGIVAMAERRFGLRPKVSADVADDTDGGIGSGKGPQITGQRMEREEL